ncbi:MAG TPA: hypothetical protein DC047_20030 [Blastocatellia bacterium]|nr:hypothetical protein [Blastocatellia bacterium]
MKHNHADKITTRMLAKSRRYSIGILLITLIAVGLFTVQPATGQRKSSQGYGKEMEVPAGVDFLKTVAGTQFRFMEEFTVPADFFDKGSRPFAGVVRLKGSPIGTFGDRKTGSADTVIERTKPASFSSGFGRAAVPIKVAALSLESVRPISVRVGKEWQQWNVKFGLSPNRTSEGTLTIMRRSENGGTFNSEFVVYGLITFTRASDGAERSLDIGKMDLGAKSIAKITLRTSGAPWQSSSRSGGSLNTGFQAGVTTLGRAVTFGENSRLANHQVILVAF